MCYHRGVLLEKKPNHPCAVPLKDTSDADIHSGSIDIGNFSPFNIALILLRIITHLETAIPDFQTRLECNPVALYYEN